MHAAKRHRGADRKALDPTRISQIARGHRDIEVRVLTLFRDEGRELVESTRLALAAGDPEGLAQAAHRLAGASANVGADRLAQFAAELEACATEGDAPSHGAGRRLGEAWDQTERAVDRRLAELS